MAIGVLIQSLHPRPLRYPLTPPTLISAEQAMQTLKSSRTKANTLGHIASLKSFTMKQLNNLMHKTNQGHKNNENTRKHDGGEGTQQLFHSAMNCNTPDCNEMELDLPEKLNLHGTMT